MVISSYFTHPAFPSCLQKEVNHITENTDSQYLDLYFEKTTGVLQELYSRVPVNENFSSASYFKIRLSPSITESPSPSIAEFQSILILPLVMIFMLLATIAVKKKNLSNQKRKKNLFSLIARAQD